MWDEEQEAGMHDTQWWRVFSLCVRKWSHQKTIPPPQLLSRQHRPSPFRFLHLFLQLVISLSLHPSLIVHRFTPESQQLRLATTLFKSGHVCWGILQSQLSLRNSPKCDLENEPQQELWAHTRWCRPSWSEAYPRMPVVVPASWQHSFYTTLPEPATITTFAIHYTTTLPSNIL